MRLSELINTLKPLFFTLLLLLLFAFLGFSLIKNAPEVKRLDYVQVKPSGQGVVLGWQELGQHRGANSAEKEHLSISYINQQWLLKNVSNSKRVDIKTTKVNTRYLRRSTLQAGDILQFNTFKIQVKRADDQLVLYDLNRKQTAVWNGSELLVDNKSGYAACERQGLRRVLGGFSDWFHWKIREYNPQNTLRLFTLGGQVHCSTRWNQTDLQPDSIRFYWENGHYWIGPGSEPSRVFIQRGGKKQDLKYLTLPIDGKEGKVKRLILGRTHYSLGANPKILTLKPIANQQVFQVYTVDDAKTKEEREALLKKADEEKQRLKEMAEQGIIPVYQQDSWIGNSVTVKPFSLRSLLLAGILVFVAIVYFFVVQRWKNTLEGGRSRVGSLFVFTGFSFALIWAAFAWRGDLGTGLVILWLSALWATVLLALQGRLKGMTSWLWFVALLIAAIGTLTLTQLAAGADNTRWLKYASGNVFIVSLVTNTIALLALAPLAALNGIWLLFIRHQSKVILWIKATLIGIVVFLLLMQFAIGTEQGIWGIQPVEIAKLLIIVIAAHALWHLKMLRSINSRYYRENPVARIILFLWVLFAFIIVSLLIAVGVHDYSPTLIVMALMAAFLWRAIPHPVRKMPVFTWTVRGVTILLPLAIMVGFALWFYQHPPDYDSSIPQAERLRIWANPELYPEAASQLLNSLVRVGQGGWFGTGWFGNNGSSMLIPAVQDDFIAAFLMNHFGAAMGLLLLSLQLLWIAIMFEISKRLAQRQRNQELYAAHNILSNILFGLTWVHLLHWMISWGNVLGLLPIMGQPMTWLSAGNSHLVAIGVMTLVLAMVGSWVAEARTE